MSSVRFGLIENAIESLDHCVRHLAEPVHASHWDLKRGILDAVHVIELILKEHLRKENEALIWEDVDKYPSPDARKVGLEKTVQRLQKIANLDFEKDDFEDILFAAKIRNKFVHYEVDMDENELKILLGRMLSFIFRFSEQYMDVDLSSTYKRDGRWKNIVVLIGLWPAYSVAVASALYAAGQPNAPKIMESKATVDAHVAHAKDLLRDSYYVFSSASVTDSESQDTFELKVLRDQRLRGKGDAAGMQVNEGGIDSREDSPHYLNAVLSLVDSKGVEIDRMILEKPLATMKEAKFEGLKSPFFLEVDYSIGMGSYNGPITSILTITNRKIKLMEAADSVSGETHQIRMMDSLKTVWKVVDERTILEVACRPDFENRKNTKDNLEFKITYWRYSLDKGKWISHTKSTPGFWENEGEFPDLSLFP